MTREEWNGKGHILKMEDSRNPKRMIKYKPEGKRAVKYQKEGWYCFEKSMEYVFMGRQRLTLEGIATDREQWKDVIGKGWNHDMT